MPDLKLDPATGDLYLAASGDLALTDDASGETTQQLIRVALKSILGEWFLDTRRGIDYFGLVWLKNPNLAAIQATFKDAILGVPGVAAITSYNQIFDRQARSLSVTGTVQTATGAVVFQTEGLA